MRIFLPYFVFCSVSWIPDDIVLYGFFSGFAFYAYIYGTSLEFNEGTINNT